MSFTRESPIRERSASAEKARKSGPEAIRVRVGITVRSFIFYALFVFGIAGRTDALDLIAPPRRGVQFETLRFRFDENLHFGNPFDLETNRVRLRILQPDSSRLELSFFHDGLNESKIERWEARFSPKQPGLHLFSVEINGEPRAQLAVPVARQSGGKQGGLRLSDRFGVFRHENGDVFRGIGLNVCWSSRYGYYFEKMKKSGMNTTRIWMCPWHLSIEWSETGLGRYDLKSARRLDTILDLADTYGIYVILCLDYHGVAQKAQGFFRENRWRENPYNKRNGGPCADPAALFTDSTAKAYAKRKYRYIVSRYGHSANVAAWEFFNEADLMAGKAVPVNRWHVEMAGFVKSIDVHDRLVSSSSTRGYGEKLVDAFRDSAMDFIMFHDYNMLDVAPHLINIVELGDEYYRKPVVIGEFGIEYRGGGMTGASDPEHVGLHNGTWAGFFSETPILPMSWWWDSYIDTLDLWYHFANLSRFADSLDFAARPLVFSTLECDFPEQYPRSRASCTVQSIRAGNRHALWFKNGGYVWSAKSSRIKLERIGAFTQKIPLSASGTFLVSWFDPQGGLFLEKTEKIDCDGKGILHLPVPSFLKDLACIVAPVR